VRIVIASGHTPSLAWLGAKRAPTTARIAIDDRVISVPIASRSGMTALPPLPPGAHTLRLIDGAGAQWMVSRAAGGDWRLRRLWALSERQPLNLRVTRERNGREFLHVLVFAPNGAGPPRLSAEFTGPGGTTSAQAERRPSSSPPTDAWPLWQNSPAWRGPQRWSIAVPDNTAGREARVRLRCADCRDLRVLVFRMSQSPAPRQLHARAIDRNDDE
jgi:hypothetical protein